MAADGSPAVARHRLRRALREAREEKRFTQRQVATALEWSMSKINRIEAGDVTVSSTDLQALLRLFEVTDSDRVRRLTEQARLSRRRDWWDRAPYRERLTQAMIQLAQFERDVSVIRSFQPKVLPGMLQTHEYAQAILSGAWSAQLSEEVQATRLEVRVHQREQFLARSEPPECFVVLDESVLLREVGGPAVVADQLYDLLGLIRGGRVTVRILPFSHPGSYAAFGSFFLCGDPDDDVALLYRETYESDEAIFVTEIVRRHRALFERIWAESLDFDASVHLIEARAATHRSTADRLAPSG